MLSRSGGAWNTSANYSRPDMGKSLQAGFFIAVIDGSPSDLRVEFEDITFRTPESASDCSQ